ncbi:MAG: AAA family ATPase [Candidatus Woesearchaeota archaeon]
MTLEIILNKEDFAKTIKHSSKVYKDQISLAVDITHTKFKDQPTIQEEAKTLVNETCLLFTSIYSQTEKILENNPKFSQIPDFYKKNYLTFITTEGILQTMSKYTQIDIVPTIKKPNMAFNKGSYCLMSEFIEDLTETIEKTYIRNPTKIISNYVANIKDTTSRKLNLSKQLKNNLKNITIKSEYFEISGLEETIFKNEQEEDTPIAKKQKNKILYDPINITQNFSEDNKIQYEDIIGNNEAKYAIKQNIRKLLTYDKEQKQNSEQRIRGMQQLFLLYGMPGCGKSMIGQAAAYQLLDIAKEYKKDVEIVKLDFDTSWKSGEVQILEHQLKYITQPDKIRLVILDEMDKYFRTRNNNESSEDKKVVTSFLQIDNHAVYPNHGNYIIIATTNKPKDTDKAILDRFQKGGIYCCTGPETPEQKIELLNKTLEKENITDQIDIKNWDVIGQMIKSNYFSGRIINGITQKIKGEVYCDREEIPDHIYFNANANQLKDIFYSNRKTISQDKIMTIITDIEKNKDSINNIDRLFSER